VEAEGQPSGGIVVIGAVGTIGVWLYHADPRIGECREVCRPAARCGLTGGTLITGTLRTGAESA